MLKGNQLLGRRRHCPHSSWAQKIFFILFLLLQLEPAQATKLEAGESTPRHFSLEPKVNLWFPTDATVKTVLNSCCHFSGEIEFGYLFRNGLNVTTTAGFGLDTGGALGLESGNVSGDDYTLLLFPARTDLLYRLRFVPNQLLVPYLRVGLDLVTFKESSGGESILGTKWGWHGGAGLALLLDRLDPPSSTLENDLGINDVYLTLEGRYSQINNFATSGLDLSGFYTSVGLLFYF